MGNSQPIHRTTINELVRGTPGSAGLDLPSSQYLILTPESEVMLIPTGIFGPLPEGHLGLIIGRSSIAKAGIQVIPGVVDSDYQGEIKIMVSPPTKTVQVFPQQRIAQLLLIPYLKLPNRVLQEKREAGFGSTNAVAWVQKISENRPMKTIEINGKKFKGLLDTGADVTCIAGQDWPSAWPTTRSPSTLIGLGLASNVAKSSSILHWKDKEKSGTFQPYIIPSLPFTLWGRDLMEQLNITLTDEQDTPFS